MGPVAKVTHIGGLVIVGRWLTWHVAEGEVDRNRLWFVHIEQST
jgi:hypothetical protein